MEMTKYFCDRCGKEIDKYKISLLRHRIRYGEVIVEVRQISDSDFDHWHDICVECEEKFIHWFNHPEEDGGDKT